MLHGSDPVIATAKLDAGDERSVLIIEGLESLVEARDRRATLGVLNFNSGDDLKKHRDRFLGAISKYNGDVPLKASFTIDNQSVLFVLKDNDNRAVTVAPSEELCNEVEQIFGRPLLSFR